MSPRRADSDLDGVINSLRRITQGLRLSSSVVQHKLGITGAQLFVLQQLAEHPVSSLRELQARTFTDQSSVSVVVSRLVTAGHITRRRSKTDARRIELSLTTSGRALLRRAPELAQTRLVETLRAIGGKELKVTRAVLDKIATEIGPEDETAMFFEPPATKPRRA
jgi:DNA-binding MarR family transcriptional regulator